MPFVGDSRTAHGPGFLPLQHHYPKDAQNKFPLHHRASVIGCRIVDRRMKSQGRDVGHWVYDNRSIGDLICSMLWDIDRTNQTERKIPGWAFAWPTIIKNVSGGSSKIGQGKPGSTSAAVKANPISETVLPIRETPYAEDSRFLPLTIPTPRKDGKDDGKVLWNRFPVGTIGISMASTEHDKQNELFFHSDPRIVAANRDGLPDFSNWIYDINGKREYDDERRARIHTLLRVIKYTPRSNIPGNVDEGSLAWQLGTAGLDDAPGYGVVYFADGTQAVIGLTSDFMSGFYSRGSGAKDKHFFGMSKDNEPITAGHLSTESYFHRNATDDAPLKFEGEAKPESTYPHCKRARLVYDDKEVHPFKLGQRKGIWKIQTDAPYYPVITGTEHKMPPWSPQLGSILDKSPDQLKSEPPKYIPMETSSIITPPQGKAYGIYTREPSNVFRPDSVLYGPWRKEQGMTNYIVTPQEVAHTSVLFKPQQNFGRAIDLRYSLNPSKIDIDNYTRSAPVVMRMEGFGNSNGNDAWDYTKNGGFKMGRYPGGSADGGIYFMPPELDMADCVTDFARPDLSLSTSLMAYHPNVQQFFGTLGFNKAPATPSGIYAKDGFLMNYFSYMGAAGYLISRVASGVTTPVLIIHDTGILDLQGNNLDNTVIDGGSP